MKIATHNVEFLFEEGIHLHSGKQWEYSKEFVEERISHFSKLFTEINAVIVYSKRLHQQVLLKELLRRQV